MRESLTWAVFSAAVMALFGLFSALGWPGGTNDGCLTLPLPASGLVTAHECYCEAFPVADLGAPGVRQVWNTWSNLLALLFGAIVAFGALRTREGWAGTSPMATVALWPLAYICVVVFLGLGSMWFHASIMQPYGAIDVLSMFTFVLFILGYTIARLLPGAAARTWIVLGYLVLSFGLTALQSGLGIPSEYLIGAVVVAYVVFEVIVSLDAAKRSDAWGWVLYGLGWLSFGAAFVVWLLSQTGGTLCNPTGFQWHAAWHWFAGVTSVLLYFYWRRAPG
jgi:hypothetical protein